MFTSGMTRTKLGVIIATTIFASMASADQAVVVPPQKFVYCTVCHGADVMGNQNIEAPRLSGMEPWYLVRQLEAFSNGWRGTHDSDNAGIEMRPMAQALTEKEFSEAAKYVRAARSGKPAITIEGNLERGATLYQSCVACHGAKAEGNEPLGGPALTTQNDWYLATQLQHYKNGVRGSNTADTYGQQMRAAAQLLPDEVAIHDVVSYISSLNHNEEN
jgi:cytochrome c553